MHTTSQPIEEAKYRVPFSLGQPHYPGKTQPYPSHLPTRTLNPGVQGADPRVGSAPETPGMPYSEYCFCEVTQALPTQPAFLWRGGAGLTQGPQE